MPNYVYECRNPGCKHTFEMLQAWGEEPITLCPECEGVIVRVISPAGIIFKGGKPSAKEVTHKAGKHIIPVKQNEEGGQWEQPGIMDKR